MLEGRVECMLAGEACEGLWEGLPLVVGHGSRWGRKRREEKRRKVDATAYIRCHFAPVPKSRGDVTGRFRAGRILTRFLRHGSHISPQHRAHSLGSPHLRHYDRYHHLCYRSTSTAFSARALSRRLVDIELVTQILGVLYTHLLLTMGDDDFFSGLGAPTRANAPCNPLMLGEITSLSQKFLNIAFGRKTRLVPETAVSPASASNGTLCGEN